MALNRRIWHAYFRQVTGGPFWVCKVEALSRPSEQQSIFTVICCSKRDDMGHTHRICKESEAGRRWKQMPDEPRPQSQACLQEESVLSMRLLWLPDTSSPARSYLISSGSAKPASRALPGVCDLRVPWCAAKEETVSVSQETLSQAQCEASLSPALLQGRPQI